MATKYTTYNGWTNYETWAVKLWIDNDQSTQEYWLEMARECVSESGPNSPNQFIDLHIDNARVLLAERLETSHDSDSEHPVFAAAEGTVYADLLNAALGSVNWNEIAAFLLEDAAELSADVVPDLWNRPECPGDIGTMGHLKGRL